MSHCQTCTCFQQERWLPYSDGQDPRPLKRCSTGTGCPTTRPSLLGPTTTAPVVVWVTSQGARRYLCRACAEKAGWDGTFTPTSTDRLLKAQIAYQNGDLSLTDYLSEIDRATEEGATDKALRDADDAHVPALPDGVYVGIDPDPNGGSLTTFRVGGGITQLAASYINPGITYVEGNTP